MVLVSRLKNAVLVSSWPWIALSWSRYRSLWSWSWSWSWSRTLCFWSCSVGVLVVVNPFLSLLLKFQRRKLLCNIRNLLVERSEDLLTFSCCLQRTQCYIYYSHHVVIICYSRLKSLTLVSLSWSRLLRSWSQVLWSWSWDSSFAHVTGRQV